MTLAEIRRAKARKVVEIRAILARAETEKRCLTEAEQTGFDKLKGEVTGLEGNEQRAVYMSDVEHGMHPALSMCAANAVVTKDPAGSRKLDKARATGRIDGMVAMAMAFGVAAQTEETGPSVYDDGQFMFV